VRNELSPNYIPLSPLPLKVGVMSPSSYGSAAHAWTSGAGLSVAGTMTLKQCSRVNQNTSFSLRKLKNFLGSPPDLTPSGRLDSLPHLSSWHRLDRRASTLGPLTKILNTPLCSVDISLMITVLDRTQIRSAIGHII